MKRFLLIALLFLLSPFAAKGTIVINEIAWMGTENSANDEWIELYSDQQVNLTGWILEAADETPFINLEGTISANSYFLLERTDDNSVPNITADQVYTGALENSGEYLKLKNSEGRIIDEINASAGWPAGNNSTKQTMERTTNDWQTSSISEGTPKTQNSNGQKPQEPEKEPDQAAERTCLVIRLINHLSSTLKIILLFLLVNFYPTLMEKTQKKNGLKFITILTKLRIFLIGN